MSFRKLFFLFIFSCSISIVIGQTNTQQLEELLFDLPDLRFERTGDQTGQASYKIQIKQAIDHKHPEKGFFYQRLQLIHRGFDKTTVINTNGYNLQKGPTELIDLLDANYISVEHRYFGPSTPDSIEWKYLTMQQIASDYHHIKELLGKIYQKPWVSTGISKGGETCTYYRHFYPDDVSMTIAYVAPFPNALKDQRIYSFLDEVGDEACRQKILDYQTTLLKKKKELLPMFKYYIMGQGGSFDLIGGYEAAYELIVMEFPFGHFQGGADCALVPEASVDNETLVNHILLDGSFTYLFDKSTTNLAAHYYQHATQLGYYGYQTSDFGKLIEHWKGEPSACFFPHDPDLKYDPSVRNKLMEWIQTEAKNIAFIYGGMDTWTACQAEIGGNNRVKKFVLEENHHGNARVLEMSEEMRGRLMEFVERGMQ